MSVLGLILARGGSRRIPRKNLRPFYGHPLVVWAIGQGLLAQRIDTLALSSDDEEILDYGRDYFIETIKRPADLAADDCTSYPPMLHALDVLEGCYDWLCLLQPTSPLRTPEDIDGVISQAIHGDLPAVASYERGMGVPNGAVYCGRTDWLRDGGNFDSAAVGRWDMPRNRSIDIDTEDDWRQAEAYLEQAL